MDGKKVYQIEINGIKESVNAVESLNKQLSELENRIKKLESSNVKINGGSGSSTTSSKSNMDEEAKLAKQIEQIDAKREAYSKEIYQNYLAAKDVLDETVKDQKQISAQERLQANNYTNTMAGMKQELKDLKTVMNGTDLGDEAFGKMSKRAGELTTKLKEIEASYGQFGRDVGNYDRIGQGLDKLTIEVGGVAREFGSAREASKTFKNELTALEIQGKGNTKEAKELRKAYYQLTSAIDDATKSSKAMDEAMDWMTSFTAMASVGNGLKAFFGFDDNEITKSIQKLVALQNVLNGIESIRKQMDTSEGIGALLSKGSQGVDKFVASITSAEIGVNGLVKSSRLATVAVRSLSIAMKGLGIGLIIAAITGLMQVVEKAGTAIQNYFKGNADLIDKSHIVKASIDAENNALQKQRDILASNFMKGYISETEYARGNMVALTAAILDNINELDLQALAFSASADKMRAFSEALGKGFGENGIKVSSDFLDMTAIIKNIEGAKTAWKEFAKAVERDEDVITANGAKSLSEWIGSFVITADDAKDDLVSIGQIIAGDWVRNLESVNIATDEGKKKIKELVNALNNDEVVHSVMMNLDKYFPDEKVIAKINNLIKYVQELNKSFEFDAEESNEGANYWTQVRIDGMKDGAAKIKAQIDLNHKKELEQLEKNGAITAEHRKQLDEKYNRQLKNQLKSANKESLDAQNDLINLRLQMMKEGFEKEKAQLDQERKEKIQKVVQSGILVGERTVAINNLYDKKILDAKKKWAADILKTYQDLYQNIQQLNRATFNMEGDNASTNVENRRTQQKQDAGYSMINSANFDNSKSLEEYYKKVLEIEKKASEQQAQIQQERLDKELEYNKQEEELRYERLVNIENGEYKQQLEAGKITQEQYDKLMEDEKEAHNARMNALDVEYAAQSTQLVQDQCEEQQSLYNNYYSNIINDIKKDKEKVDEVISKQPITDKTWGVVNIGKTSENYKTALAQYDNLKKEIIKKQRELDAALKAKTISPEDFAMKQSELKKEVEAIDKAVEQVKKKQTELIGDFMQSIQQYIQTAADSANQILSAVWDAQDAAYDREKEQLEKQMELQEEIYNKQKELAEEHKNTINDIENELASARGDRRQHLIDQLNAEIEAQRRAVKEQQKAEREEKKLKQKAEKEELEQKKREKKRALVQALINTALSISMAAVNSWPMPAIAMMAAAAAVGAAQVAAISSQKYAKGGLLEGKSHKEGGIPVGNTGIEVEGKEYVVRKKSTTPNVELLDYINKSERKLSLDDFINFFSSGKAKKSFMSISSKYADGGVLPTLSNDYSFDDRLLSAFEDYSNRPVQVSVVDINNRQAAVKNVQVMAGLTE